MQGRGGETVKEDEEKEVQGRGKETVQGGGGEEVQGGGGTEVQEVEGRQGLFEVRMVGTCGPGGVIAHGDVLGVQVPWGRG